MRQTPPLDAVVATVTAAWSGSPFTGKLAFAQPYADDGGTVQNITIVATQ